LDRGLSRLAVNRTGSNVSVLTPPTSPVGPILTYRSQKQSLASPAVVFPNWTAKLQITANEAPRIRFLPRAGH